MRYFSTFSGIGGFELGMQSAYDHYTSLRNREAAQRHGTTSPQAESLATKQVGTQRLGNPTNVNGSRNPILDCSAPTCVGYSEKDKFAKAIYRYHFPAHQSFGDITSIDETALPDFDLLVGGFPCQAFSLAGKRRGFDDTRGSLFFDLLRIIREKQPRLLLLENVTGLLSHQNGQTFTTILTSLSELGYDLQWQVLNSKHFGVPQNRERVYIIGHLRRFGSCQVFPLTQEEVLSDQAQCQSKRAASKNQEGVIRRLIPLECERLQGFPDRWTAKGVDLDGKEITISDSQRYKVLGNAVTIPLVQTITCELLPIISSGDQDKFSL